MLRQLGDGVYVETGFEGGNVGAVLGERGALLIDAPMLPPEARQWQENLQRLGVEGIYGIVNTDYHVEHFIGNAFFMPARIFGHELGMKAVSKYSTSALEQFSHSFRDIDPPLAEEISHMTVYMPEINIGERATLYLGNQQVEILYLEGHTPASLGIYVPSARVLFAGDNVTNHEHPVMYQANSLAWLETLQRIKALDVDVIVPGSGEPGGKEMLEPLIGYITEMRQRVQDLFQSGASRREAVDKVGMLDYFDFTEDHATMIKRRRRGNIERVYAEVRSARRRR